jgi:MFS family permease
MDDAKANEEGQVVEEVIEKYSVFTRAEKWCIVAMVASAAWFSTLSSFIYFPALHILSQTFGVSVSKINLTITSYLAIATIAPTLVGDAADIGGRRPVYVMTLALYIGANIGIALSKSYHALLGLRVLQALAISGMFLTFILVQETNIFRHLFDRIWGSK